MIYAVVILSILLFAVLSYIFITNSRKSNSTEALLLKNDMNNLTKSIQDLKDGMNKQLSDQLINTNKQMASQFAASSKIISEVTRNLTELKESNKQVVSITDELKTLQNVLQNPKQRGVIGEFYLSQVLENVMTPDRYKLQYKFKDGEIVDAVIMLDKGRLLPVDSKFSLENYNRLIDEKDKTKREAIERLFKSDLKKRIDETAKYIRPKENTMDYAFMFIPSEAIYYDLLINKIGATGTSARDLIEYAFIDKNVIIVSPTTFMAYLQTVLQGLRSLQIEEQAQEIQTRVGELARHLGSYETYMQKLGSSLGTTVNHYNAAHKELGKVDKDMVKISSKTAGIKPLSLEKPTED
ncbi:MAG TPA: DNA recombination protein RmuC [Candidatus Sulfotelmatobacter sp.]|nr:DNA recombination protein RmuC [Candidatus Sulfotelmatobacter sp.]